MAKQIQVVDGMEDTLQLRPPNPFQVFHLDQNMTNISSTLEFLVLASSLMSSLENAGHMIRK